MEQSHASCLGTLTRQVELTERAFLALVQAHMASQDGHLDGFRVT